MFLTGLKLFDYYGILNINSLMILILVFNNWFKNLSAKISVIVAYDVSFIYD